MTWISRALLLACAALVAVAACGGSTDQGANPDVETPLTVFAPLGPNAASADLLASSTTSVEYQLRCRETSTGPEGEYELVDEGILEKTGELDGGPEKGITSVWEGSLRSTEGECLLGLRARDGDGEVTCVHTEPVSPLDEPAVERLVELPCYSFVSCTSTPLPGEASKSFCLSVVGVLLSVETPAALQSAERLRYEIREAPFEPPFLENNASLGSTYEGDLLFDDTTESDFGSGPEPSERWSVGIEDVVVGRYTITVTALALDDEVLCVGERDVSIVADAVAQVEFLLPCRDRSGGAP